MDSCQEFIDLLKAYIIVLDEDPESDEAKKIYRSLVAARDKIPRTPREKNTSLNSQAMDEKRTAADQTKTSASKRGTVAKPKPTGNRVIVITSDESSVDDEPLDNFNAAEEEVYDDILEDPRDDSDSDSDYISTAAKKRPARRHSDKTGSDAILDSPVPGGATNSKTGLEKWLSGKPSAPKKIGSSQKAIVSKETSASKKINIPKPTNTKLLAKQILAPLAKVPGNETTGTLLKGKKRGLDLTDSETRVEKNKKNGEPSSIIALRERILESRSQYSRAQKAMRQIQPPTTSIQGQAIRDAHEPRSGVDSAKPGNFKGKPRQVQFAPVVEHRGPGNNPTYDEAGSDLEDITSSGNRPKTGLNIINGVSGHRPFDQDDDIVPGLQNPYRSRQLQHAGSLDHRLGHAGMPSWPLDLHQGLNNGPPYHYSSNSAPKGSGRMVPQMRHLNLHHGGSSPATFGLQSFDHYRDIGDRQVLDSRFGPQQYGRHHQVQTTLPHAHQDFRDLGSHLPSFDPPQGIQTPSLRAQPFNFPPARGPVSFQAGPIYHADGRHPSINFDPSSYEQAPDEFTGPCLSPPRRNYM